MKEVKVYSLMTCPSVDEPINVQVFSDIATAVSEFVSTLEEWVGESTSTSDHSTNVSDTAEYIWLRLLKDETPTDESRHVQFCGNLLRWAKAEPRWDGQWIELQSHLIEINNH
jgi:hypothetical protein